MLFVECFVSGRHNVKKEKNESSEMFKVPNNMWKKRSEVTLNTSLCPLSVFSGEDLWVSQTNTLIRIQMSTACCVLLPFFHRTNSQE